MTGNIRLARVLSLVLMSLVAGCLETLGPDVGPLRADLCQTEDSDLDSDVSFRADILPLLTRDNAGCVPCHDPASSNPIGFAATGLRLTDYEGLVIGGDNSGENIVVPTDPCNSILVQKISSAPPFGSRMPLSGPPFLSEAEIQRIHDWIAEGARDN